MSGNLDFAAALAALMKLRVISDEDAAARSKEREAAARAELAAFWRGITPAAYHAQDDGRNPRLSAIARDWRAVSGGKPVLLLLGDSRRGKTWAAYQSLKREVLARRSIIARRVSQLNMELSALFRDDPEEHRELMRSLCRVDVLLLDDLDKAVFTERAAQELFDVVDARCSARLPIIITANASPRQLRELLDKNGHRFAGPMVNRLVEVGHVEAFAAEKS